MAVVKVIEVMGTSDSSWEDAAETAFREAQETVDNISGLEIKNWTADVEEGDITQYRATVDVAFRVES